MGVVKKMKDIAGGFQTNIANSLIKQKLADRFDFKKIHSFTFSADRKKDLLLISAWGLKEKSITPEDIKAEPMKLSENPEIENTAMRQAANYLPMHVIKDIVILEATMDFENKRMIGICKYVSMEDKREMRKFNSAL